MKILMVTFGSVGDVLPYVALGKGLVARGHSVTICTNASLEPLVAGHGLSYAHMNDGFPELIRSTAGRAAMTRLPGLARGAITAVRMARQLAPLMERTVHDSWVAAEATRPEVIVFHPKATWIGHFAERLGARAIAAPLFPQFVRTAAFPSIGFPTWNLGGRYNRLTYDVVVRSAGLIGGKLIRAWRAANGLAPRAGPRDVLHDAAGAPIPVLHGYSQHVSPVPADWPPHATATGFWSLDQQDVWPFPPELDGFLNDGERPVYVGFGSLAGLDPESTTRTVIEALRIAKVRGVIATGWGGLTAADLPDSILRVDSSPHDRLFPRVAAVVHHGGAGTTAAGLRAGCPTVVCPFFGDQPFWGRRVHALGVGPEPIPQQRLTARRLAASIQRAVRDPVIRSKATRLGIAVRGEDGVANAIAVIEAGPGANAGLRPAAAQPRTLGLGGGECMAE